MIWTRQRQTQTYFILILNSLVSFFFGRKITVLNSWTVQNEKSNCICDWEKIIESKFIFQNVFQLTCSFLSCSHVFPSWQKKFNKCTAQRGIFFIHYPEYPDEKSDEWHAPTRSHFRILFSYIEDIQPFLRPYYF